MQTLVWILLPTNVKELCDEEDFRTLKLTVVSDNRVEHPLSSPPTRVQTATRELNGTFRSIDSSFHKYRCRKQFHL